MKFSIITVCKTAEKAIERTMLSVFNQTYKDIEYIVVDGASKDGTVEIIRKYTERYQNIKWISEPDSGIYQAMNKGIKMATGDYVLFLNAGDYLIHYNVLDLVRRNYSDEFDIIIGNCFGVNPFDGKCQIIKGHGEPDLFFFYNHSLPHQAIFYRKKLFDKFGNYDESFKILGDALFNKKIFTSYKVVVSYIDMIISVYFFDGVSSLDTNSPESIINKERSRIQKYYFSRDEKKIVEISTKKYRKFETRQKKKSLLRFSAKVLIKLYRWWIRR